MRSKKSGSSVHATVAMISGASKNEKGFRYVVRGIGRNTFGFQTHSHRYD